MDHRAAADHVARELRAAAGDAVDRIILYGSVVRGEAGPDSDVDMIVVTSDYKRVHRALTPILGHLLEVGAPLMSVMILTRDQVADMERRRWFFWTTVREEGEALA